MFRRILAAAALLLAGGALAQTYPAKAIRLVVPFTPGTGYDSIARIVGPTLSQRLGQPVVVENIPGASSTIGAASVARAAPDGYTLLMIGEGTMASGHLYRSLQFNPLTDFAPISLAGHGTLMLVASQASGLRSVAELIAKAKAEPGKLTFSSPGVGTSQYLKMALFTNTAGIDMLHVPYKGSAGAINDLLSGLITAGLVPIHAGMQHIAAGKLSALAIISPSRNPIAPDVPTLQEAGIQGVDANMWYAFVAPRGTPAPVVSRLNAELRAIMELPDVKGRLEKTGLEVHTTSPAELQAIMQRESDTAAQIVRRNNISLD
jgi:tripartite-type tricarboxylate transporter receptor subunit TctC